MRTFTGWAANSIETRRSKLLSFSALLQSFALERCLDLFYIIFSWTFLEFQNWNAPKNAKNASTNDPSIWKQFKDARNKANNSVKKAKRKYFSENLDANKSDPRKTWRLINELQSRQSKSTKVSQVKTGNQVFTSPGDIAEAFNNHFTNIGQSLAQEIPSSEIDPLAYVNPVDGVFSFQRINVQKVIKLIKAIDISKALSRPL